MSETCDVVVVGVGAMGASATYHLARRGVDVVGIELHTVPHERGSSHGGSRVIRKAYFEDARYVPLLERSYALWRELEHESGQRLLHLVGTLNIGRRENGEMRALMETVRTHALAHELLDGPALRARFPAFGGAGDDVIGLYEAAGGLLPPERCTAAHVELAVRSGARVHVRERVRAVSLGAGGGGVVVESDARTLHAKHAVLSLGPWLPSAQQTLSGLPGVVDVMKRLRAQRQPQLWFAPPNEHFACPAGAGAPGLPTFIRFGDDGATYYGLPPFGGDGVKVCRHGAGAAVTPDTIERDVSAADVDDVRAFMRATLPALAEQPLTRSAACMYTMAPDGHFVVGALPTAGEARVVLLSPCSGHGFKMASVMGEIAADLVVDGRSRHDISLFDPARFSG